MNWREARIENTDLKILLPCKPDKASKQLDLNGIATRIEMIGCEAGGGLFAVSRIKLSKDVEPGAVLSQWKSSVIAGIKASEHKDYPFQIKGESPDGLGNKLEALGKSPDGKPIMLKAVWFVQNRQLFHAAIYADQLQPETAETFFSGLVFP
jgi:hypothetical protein